jgi:hypothetical protein
MYQVGQVVVSNVNAQGLVAGVRYEVVASRVRRTFVGGFTTYSLRCLDRTICRSNPDGTDALISVGNGHLVLEAVS